MSHGTIEQEKIIICSIASARHSALGIITSLEALEAAGMEGERFENLMKEARDLADNVEVLYKDANESSRESGKG